MSGCSSKPVVNPFHEEGLTFPVGYCHACHKEAMLYAESRAEELLWRCLLCSDVAILDSDGPRQLSVESLGRLGYVLEHQGEDAGWAEA